MAYVFCHYCPPTKLQEGNVFTGVRLFRVWGGGELDRVSLIPDSFGGG